MPKLKSLVQRWCRLTGPAPMRDFDDYDEYWEQRGTLIPEYRRWNIAIEMIESGSTVLDVGCGTGQFLDLLRSTKPDVVASGVDFSQTSVDVVRKFGFEAHIHDISRDEITGQYDYITCFEVLEHLADAESAILRLRNAFRKRLIISIPNIGYIGCRARLALFGRFPVTNCFMHIKEHLRHWTPTDFHEWVKHFGLHIVDIKGQYGIWGTPWKAWPSLFSSGIVYALEHDT